jgi:hypothetical protein
MTKTPRKERETANKTKIITKEKKQKKNDDEGDLKTIEKSDWKNKTNKKRLTCQRRKSVTGLSVSPF